MPRRRKPIFSFLSPKAKVDLVYDLSEMKPYLSRLGIDFEEHDPVHILGISMDRVRMRHSGQSSALGFGGGYFHIARMVEMNRALWISEFIEFNAKTQIFNVTVSNEPLGAIIKAHIPAQYGVPPEMVVSLLGYLDQATTKFIGIVGPESTGS